MDPILIIVPVVFLVVISIGVVIFLVTRKEKTTVRTTTQKTPNVLDDRTFMNDLAQNIYFHNETVITYDALSRETQFGDYSGMIVTINSTPYTVSLSGNTLTFNGKTYTECKDRILVSIRDVVNTSMTRVGGSTIKLTYDNIILVNRNIMVMSDSTVYMYISYSNSFKDLNNIEYKWNM